MLACSQRHTKDGKDQGVQSLQHLSMVWLFYLILSEEKLSLTQLKVDQHSLNKEEAACGRVSVLAIWQMT